jgi:uncharacterized membrane protein
VDDCQGSGITGLLLLQQAEDLLGREKMKKIVCVVTYWLLLLAPIAAVLFSMPQKRRLILAIPAGMALALFGDRGLKKWKQLWRVG